MKVVGKVLNEYKCIWREGRLAKGEVGPCKLQPVDTLNINQCHQDWLKTRLLEPFDGPTVVVTHYAPHRSSLASVHFDDWVSCGYVNDLAAEFFNVPLLWVHGHTHQSFDYMVGNCRVVCNPGGYVKKK